MLEPGLGRGEGMKGARDLAVAIDELFVKIIKPQKISTVLFYFRSGTVQHCRDLIEVHGCLLRRDDKTQERSGWNSNFSALTNRLFCKCHSNTDLMCL